MNKTRTLHKNEWVSLMVFEDPENGVPAYVYSHETRCDGHIVALLPYRTDKNGDFEFLLRNEPNPIWNRKDMSICSITGGLEWEDLLGTCANELKEEGGYSADQSEFISLGKSFGTKSTDTIFHLYTIDLTDRTREEATGDGSALEEQSECFWCKTISASVDPLIYVMYYRLMKHFGKI